MELKNKYIELLKEASRKTHEINAEDIASKTKAYYDAFIKEGFSEENAKGFTFAIVNNLLIKEAK